MDPATLTLAEWTELGAMIRNLWFVVIFVVIFAANMIVGHNLIPTFIESEHISRSWQKARAPFYILAIVSIFIALFFFIQVVDHASVLRVVWEDYYI